MAIINIPPTAAPAKTAILSVESDGEDEASVPDDEFAFPFDGRKGDGGAKTDGVCDPTVGDKLGDGIPPREGGGVRLSFDEAGGDGEDDGGGCVTGS